jgi:uncharacterized protein (TIGR01777 family)
MHIVVAGASGFLGSRLRKELQAGGHRVTQLVRSAPSAPDQVRWDPDGGKLGPAVLAGADAVINLCGVGVGDKRWTPAYKELIRTSRVRPTELLAKTSVDAGVPVLVNASAVGYYGPRGDEKIDESAHAGTSFLAGVCVDWENATAAAADGGVRVAAIRTGLVLGREGGLLPKVGLLTKLLAGGRLGSGRQYYPWISATDEIDAIVFLLTADVAGPVNLTAPVPVTNADFTRELGRALHRPTPWVVPKFALSAVLGEFAGEVTTGQNAVPTVLTESGYTFQHPTLAEALQAELS